MRNVLSITRMSAADAVAVNEKVQVAVNDAVSGFGEEVVGAAVTDAAAALSAATVGLEQIEGASFELRREVDTSADRCLGAIVGRAENVIPAYESAIMPLTETQQTELDAARWMLSNCFPYGRAFIAGRWSEQFGVTEMILKTAAQPEAAPMLEALESYLGAVIYAQNKNPDLKAKLTAPYESSAQAVRDARRRPAEKAVAEAPAA